MSLSRATRFRFFIFPRLSQNLSKLDNPVELHVLSFPGLFRLDDVSRIRSNDIFFNGGFMVMKVPKSENVQPSFGDKVVISELPSRACPVMLLKKYLAKFR